MEGAQQCCLLCRWYVGSQLTLVTVYKIRILLCNSKSQQRAGPLWGLQDLVILAYHCFYENCFVGCSKNSSVGVSVMTWPGFHSWNPVSVSVLLVLMSWTRRAEKVVSSLDWLWLWGVASGNIHGHIYRSEKQQTFLFLFFILLHAGLLGPQGGLLVFMTVQPS